MVITQAAARLGVASGKAAGIGTVAGIALLVPMEAGVPIPIPADLVMLAVGARVSAGDIPLAVAIVAFEAVAIVGTTALFLAARGPGHAVVSRLAPRLGLSVARLGRAASLIERRGRPALAVGRATPGLRTLTVIAAGASGLSMRRAAASSCSCTSSWATFWDPPLSMSCIAQPGPRLRSSPR